jgi:hypothetical protein
VNKTQSTKHTRWRRGAIICAMVVMPLLVLAAIPATLLPAELTVWMDAIVKVESGRKPWVILNNTYYRRGEKGASKTFATRAEAETYASEHIAMNHDLDLGMYQLNWKYQKHRAGVSLANIFDPYVQEQIGKQVLAEFYAAAKRVYGAGELAQRRAVSAYNNGNIHADNGKYLAAVYRVMGKSTAGLVSQDASHSASAAGLTQEQGASTNLGAKPSKTNTPGLQSPAEVDSNEVAGQPAEDTSEDSPNSSPWSTLLLIVVAAAAIILCIKLSPMLAKLAFKGAFTMAKKGAARGLRRAPGALKRTGDEANKATI